MAMHVTIELTCDNCKEVIDHSDQFEMYADEQLGDAHWFSDMVKQDDGEWYCQDCDKYLNVDA